MGCDIISALSILGSVPISSGRYVKPVLTAVCEMTECSYCKLKWIKIHILYMLVRAEVQIGCKKFNQGICVGEKFNTLTHVNPHLSSRYFLYSYQGYNWTPRGRLHVLYLRTRNNYFLHVHCFLSMYHYHYDEMNEFGSLLRSHFSSTYWEANDSRNQ